MKNILLVYLLILISNSTFSQNNTQPLRFKNGFFGWQFNRGEEKLKIREVAEILKPHTEAYQLFQRGKTNNTLSVIIGSVGGAMLGYTIGTSMGGGDANWTVGGIGAGIVAVSLPLSISAYSKVRKAIVLYNEATKTGSIRKAEWQLKISSGKVGLACRF